MQTSETYFDRFSPDEASAFHATLVSERLSQIKPQESSDGLNAARCCAEGQGCGSTGSCSYNRWRGDASSSRL